MSRIAKTAAMTVALTLAAPGAANAQTKPAVTPPAAVVPATKPGAESLEQARRLIKVTDVAGVLDQMFTALAPIFGQGVIGVLSGDDSGKALLAQLAAKPGAHERLLVLLSTEYLAGIKRRTPDMLEQLAGEYATRFTLEELREINAFYATGAGGKLIAMQSALQQSMSEAGKVVGEAAGSEAAEKALDKLEAELGLHRSTGA